MAIKLCMLGVWMALVPFGIGYFALGLGKGKEIRPIGFSFCLGYILMWAIFQLIAVPCVLKEENFRLVERIFTIISLTIAAFGFFLFLMHCRAAFGKNRFSYWKEQFKNGWKERLGMLPLFLWVVFLAGLLFQVVQSYRLAYADGDDAYYIPISTMANLGGAMYTLHPYTGEPTGLDMRHGLAPFPIWVSFIAAKCDVNAAVAAHSLIPLILIPVTYLLYLEIGKLLCKDVLLGAAKRGRLDEKTSLPFFMILVSLLQIFGNYSIYPASTFLLTRTRQGKAALGNIILPFLFLLFYKMAEEVKKQGKAGVRNMLWLMAAMVAGCLCSAMAVFLCGMAIMLTTFLIFILYRKPHILWQGLLGCMPGVAYALLYLK